MRARRRDLAEYRRRYDMARHHAWGGLGFLSVVSAIRYFYPSLDDRVFMPAVAALVAYIVVWLFLTYRYRACLKLGIGRESPAYPSRSGEERAEKLRLKGEKKRLKAEVKLRKKAGG